MSDRAVVATVDEPALVRLAGELAKAVGGGGVMYLVGPLGAGKTTFARALLTALGVGSRVKSPTYSLIESYSAGALGVQHLDLYRIADPEEIEWLGLRDFADPQLWLIEWPERAVGAIPAADLVVRLAHASAARDMRLEPATSVGESWLMQLAVMDTSRRDTAA